MTKTLIDCKFKNFCIDTKAELEKKPVYSEGEVKIIVGGYKGWGANGRVDRNFWKDGEREFEDTTFF